MYTITWTHFQVKDVHYSTPVHEACRKGRVDILDVLLDEVENAPDVICSPDPAGQTLLALACRTGSDEVRTVYAFCYLRICHMALL